MLVCLKYWLFSDKRLARVDWDKFTYARTLEKSADGDITKLSALADHDIRCWMLGSSSMLRCISQPPLLGAASIAHLYSLWMNAVWTIFGWWTAAAAAAGAAGIVTEGLGSVGEVFLRSPLASGSCLVEGEEEVISIGSPGDGADIWIVGVGVGIGTIRFDVRSAWPSAGRGTLCGLSVTVAIPSTWCKDTC